MENKIEPPKTPDLETEMEDAVADQLGRYRKDTSLTDMLLYLIHKDLQRLHEQRRQQHADRVRGQAGF